MEQMNRKKEKRYQVKKAVTLKLSGRCFMKYLVISILTLILFACTTASQHYQSLHSTQEREMTVGIVQKEIKIGMSQAQVAEALGSPNIVTSDEVGRETWIYDKIASEVSYSRDAGSVGGGAGGGGVPGTTLIIGLLGGGYSKEAGAVAKTQKTLTVVIKFKEGKVDAFSYHASKF
jgi:outer membrane protein assembly factor BamE (lipoprotein component of BamABCDE complex)